MKNLERNLATLAGTYLTAAALLIGMIDVKLAKENKISLENCIKNTRNAVINFPYTVARSFFGFMGKDILTGKEIVPGIGAFDCAIDGTVDQMIYTLGIVIPYKTKDVGGKRNFYEEVTEILTQEATARNP